LAAQATRISVGLKGVALKLDKWVRTTSLGTNQRSCAECTHLEYHGDAVFILTRSVESEETVKSRAPKK
jgi:hypothetical protein